MKRVLLSFILLSATFIFVAAQESTPTKKFGYLSYDAVLKAMPSYAEAQKSFNDLKASYAKELERSESEFSKQFAEYVDGQKTFPENILLKRQKELQQLMEQSLSFKQEAQQLLDKAEKELMQPVHQKLKEALYKIGSERGYDYILNTDNNNYPFVNNQTGEDITAEAISAVSK
ncbi:MAG: OmpH family outer membrane protein [Bacteroidaceae bacterium]|nr:OmpH family outer membrane protein [Bacteroidaceae bacterium]